MGQKWQRCNQAHLKECKCSTRKFNIAPVLLGALDGDRLIEVTGCKYVQTQSNTPVKHSKHVPVNGETGQGLSLLGTSSVSLFRCFARSLSWQPRRSARRSSHFSTNYSGSGWLSLWVPARWAVCQRDQRSSDHRGDVAIPSEIMHTYAYIAPCVTQHDHQTRPNGSIHRACFTEDMTPQHPNWSWANVSMSLANALPSG